MSGIAGIFWLDGRHVDREELAQMNATLVHRGGDGHGLWYEGAAGLTAQVRRVTPESLRETQPLVHRSRAVVVFDGRLDNREELFHEIADTALAHDAPDPVLVLEAYERFGHHLPEHLNGDFALAVFDSLQRRLLLARDALGVRPLYYYRTRNVFLFASEIKALLVHREVSTRPSDVDLADSLVSDNPLRNEGLTYFEDVLAVPPAHTVTVTPLRFEVRRYWDFDGHRQLRLGSAGEYAEAFRHHFETAVRRRIRSAYPIGFSVSGGLDSSSIFCLAERLRRQALTQAPLHAFTMDTPRGTPADEMMYVRAIERDYGVTVERVPVDPGVLDGSAEDLESFRKLIWHVESPGGDDQWNTSQRFFAVMQRQSVRLLITGHWADQVLFAQAYLMDLVRRFRWRTAWKHLREYPRWMTDTDPHWFKRRLLLDLLKYHVPSWALPALRRIRASVRAGHKDFGWYSDRLRRLARTSDYRYGQLQSRFATVHAQALYEEVRSRYHVVAMEWNSKLFAMFGMECAFPFLDRDLVAFLMAIPGDIQTKNGVPKGILREGLRDVLPPEIGGRRWKADFVQLITEGAKRDYRHIAARLHETGPAVQWGYAESVRMKRMLAVMPTQMDDGTGTNADHLMNLLALNLWLEMFFGTHKARAAAAEMRPPIPTTSRPQTIPEGNGPAV